jgi:hypothetical protein
VGIFPEVGKLETAIDVEGTEEEGKQLYLEYTFVLIYLDDYT